jgi:hypothetical protein
MKYSLRETLPEASLNLAKKLGKLGSINIYEV